MQVSYGKLTVNDGKEVMVASPQRQNVTQ